MRKKIWIPVLIVLAAAVVLLCVAFRPAGKPSPLPVKVLILPKFEINEMNGDTAGEAQYYYDHYLSGSEVYEVPNSGGTARIYYKDGIALSVQGMGKVNATMNTVQVLSDSRFDFSNAYILSTGCAGAAVETMVMGDVCVASAAVDFDLGHHADSRDLADAEGTTWFHDVDFDDTAAFLLDRKLTEKVYALVKDTPLQTTERVKNYMRRAFDGAAWAVRDPKVILGTTMSGDNYWKGRYDHENAVLMAKTYQCPDPFATTEMEDAAIACVLDRMGMLDRLIILRGAVNMDVYMLGATPEILWGGDEDNNLSDEDYPESAGIFDTAMKNNFEVGRVIIDRILAGEF